MQFYIISMLTLNFLSSRVCCLFRIDGLVSKECGRFRFLAEAIAAAAAIPTGPNNNNKHHDNSNSNKGCDM